MLKYIPFTHPGLAPVIMKNSLSMLLCGLLLAAGCAEEAPPRSVADFLDNPIVLEATVVRCARNRSESRYNTECVNARQAVSIIEAKEERARRDAFEAQSSAKRDALRRTQRAAAEARRRAAEADRKRKEAAYLAQFGVLSPLPENSVDVDETNGNAPGMSIFGADQQPETGSPPTNSNSGADDGNSEGADSEPPSGLDAIREELRKRDRDSDG